MDYQTVFDAAQHPFRNAWFAGFGLLFVVVGLVLIFSPRFRAGYGGMSRGFASLFAWGFFVFAFFWTIIAGSAVLQDQRLATESLNTGKCSVIEGRVENFKPMNGKVESFTVDGIEFEYSDYEVSAGFNTTSYNHGPIREGLPVRICHDDGRILRLEVASAPDSDPPLH